MRDLLIAPPEHHMALAPTIQDATLESALPKTPVCIGSLTMTALIIYPSAYLEIPPPEQSGSDLIWGPVLLQCERSPYHPEDSISIRTPNKRDPHGEIHPGEKFAVVEQRAASVLGPMLGNRLIRLDSGIRRGNRHVRVLSF